MGTHAIFCCPLIDVGEFALRHGAVPLAAERLLCHRPRQNFLDGNAARVLG
jgi:hypothetical protein